METMIVAEVKENSDGTKEVEVKCHCGRKITVKFLAPVIIEQDVRYQLRGESAS